MMTAGASSNFMASNPHPQLLLLLNSLSPPLVYAFPSLCPMVSAHTHSPTDLPSSATTFENTLSLASQLIASASTVLSKGPSTHLSVLPSLTPPSLKCPFCSFPQGVSQGHPPRCPLNLDLPPGPLSLISPKTQPMGPISVMGTLTPWPCSEGRCLSSR